jgi:diacylglycerol kinase family enzyme
VRVTLIHNPKAGKQAMTATQLKKLLRDAGHDVRYQSAKEDGWKKALKKDADLVVVAGGDGTVGRVVRRMAGRRVPVALLPSGTANNIARTLGQLERPFEELLRGWETARRVKLDVPVAKGPWGERNFVEGLGAGLFSTLLGRSEIAPPRKKKRPVEDALARLQRLAAEVEPMDIRAKLDGEDISGRYVLLEALNLPYVGPNLHLAPDSRPGDGQFEVVLVTEAERPRLVHYLGEWQQNRERLSVLPSRRGRKLELEWTGFPLHIDDKLRPKQSAEPEEMAGRVEARIGRDQVEFLVPEARNRHAR